MPVKGRSHHGEEERQGVCSMNLTIEIAELTLPPLELERFSSMIWTMSL